MLNPFPIQFLALLAHLLLRLFVGFISIYLGTRHIKNRHDLKYSLALRWFPYGLFSAWCPGIVELVIGLMFILGFYTQIAALIAMVLSVKMLVLHRRFASSYIPGKLFFVLFFAASLSLFITGAGALAFDLPI